MMIGGMAPWPPWIRHCCWLPDSEITFAMSSGKLNLYIVNIFSHFNTGLSSHAS